MQIIPQNLKCPLLFHTIELLSFYQNPHPQLNKQNISLHKKNFIFGFSFCRLEEHGYLFWGYLF